MSTLSIYSLETLERCWFLYRDPDSSFNNDDINTRGGTSRRNKYKHILTWSSAWHLYRILWIEERFDLFLIFIYNINVNIFSFPIILLNCWEDCKTVNLWMFLLIFGQPHRWREWWVNANNLLFLWVHDLSILL